jgi:rhodanese-related sulfurtransferase
MSRRIFLALVVAVALSCVCASARQPPQVPADRIPLEEFKTKLAAGKVFVLDVRYVIDKKIKGATHITLDQLESHLPELPRDREIVTYCS